MGTSDGSSNRQMTLHLVGINMIKCSHSKLKSSNLIVFNTSFKTYIDSSHSLLLDITIFGTVMNEKGTTSKLSEFMEVVFYWGGGHR